MPFFESLKEFSIRHGGRTKSIDVSNSRTVWEDGAIVEGGIRYEPPEDEWQLLRIQRQYWQEKLDREVNGFVGYQQQLIYDAQLAKNYRNLPGPDEESLEPLRAGRERISALKEQLAAIDEQLDKSPAAKARRERGRVDEREQQHLNELLGKLKAFNV